jgi:hypothetical protein
VRLNNKAIDNLDTTSGDELARKLGLTACTG